MPLGRSILKNCRVNASCVNCYVTLSINLPIFHGRNQARDNAQSPLSAPSVRTPAVYCTAASLVLPAVPGVAVFVLHGDAVDGKGSAILEPGFHPVSVHVIVAGNQFVHTRTSCMYSSSESSWSCHCSYEFKATEFITSYYGTPQKVCEDYRQMLENALRTQEL